MFQSWSYNPENERYIGVRDTASRLPSGLYAIDKTMYGEPCAIREELRADKIVRFENGPLKEVLREADTFWKSAARYHAMRVSHKRGVLLHGDPGNGKTGIISALIEDTLARDGLAFQVHEVDDFAEGIPLLRQIEPGRPLLALLEDLEKFLGREEEALLELMDGASSVCDSILFVATTNHLSKIPPRLRCRPSRIDTLIEIGPPEESLRREYLRLLLGADREADRLACHWASRTGGFSLASLKELVISVRVYEKSLEESIGRLTAMATPEGE